MCARACMGSCRQMDVSTFKSVSFIMYATVREIVWFSN